MSKMSKHWKVLELDRVLERLAQLTGNADAAQMARELAPTDSLYEAQRLLDQTDCAYILSARFGSPSFGGMSNIKSSLCRAQAGASLSLRELLNIGENLRIYRSLIEWRGRAGEQNVLDALFEGITPLRRIEEKLLSSVLSEEEVADGASEKLASIRRKIRSTQNSVREKLDKIIRSPQMSKYLQEPVVTIRSGRFVVPVKLEHRSNVPGLVHDTSSSGATVFVEPMSVVEANNEIKVLINEEDAEIERIIAELSALVGEYADEALVSYDCAVELCLIFAKANLAYDMKASKPILNDKGLVRLNKARHPLIDPKKVVAIDVTLGDTFDTLIVTGPNTGGKTVTLKTIGLLTLMAACGMLIPAGDNSHIAIFSSVMADIGDEQSIEQSLSTFSSHMVNLVDILDNCGRCSLVLVDELGAGTDPVEGAALAQALIEALRARGCRVAATTHYAELKAYAIDTAGVENACCEFDVATLSPTYRLLIGMPGRSNAFAISERLGLSADIVRRAKGMISDSDKRFEGVVRSLEQARRAAEDERRETARLRAELDEAKKVAKESADKAVKEYDRVVEKAQKDAQRIIDKATRTADGMIAELTELRKQAVKGGEADMLAKARAAVKKAENSMDSQRREEDVKYELPRPLVVGDYVHVVDANCGGYVLRLPNSSGSLTVDINGMKMSVNVGRIRLVDAPKAKKSQTGGRRTTTVTRANTGAKTEIDLRGRTADEAIMELDRFIDSAMLSGMNFVHCIHGKGTGVLRKAIHDHLRRHKQVRSWRLGLYGEGEDGVTIIELK